MKTSCFFVVLCSLGFVLSCVSNDSKPKAEAAAATDEAAPHTDEQEEVFDPDNVTEDIVRNTKMDVQHFISELNVIIRGKNYDGWKAALSEEYFYKISSPEFLKSISDRPAMQSQNLVLRTPEEYFLNVVVPSRANDRVDDIQFITKNRVKAFTINPNNGQRLRLYDLEHTENSWVIIN